MLILAASGQRCADLVRELRPLLGPLEAAPAAAAAVAGKGKGKKEGEKGVKPAKKAKVEAPTKPKYGEIAKVRSASLGCAAGRTTDPGRFSPRPPVVIAAVCKALQGVGARTSARLLASSLLGERAADRPRTPCFPAAR